MGHGTAVTLGKDSVTGVKTTGYQYGLSRPFCSKENRKVAT